MFPAYFAPQKNPAEVTDLNCTFMLKKKEVHIISQIVIKNIKMNKRVSVIIAVAMLSTWSLSLSAQKGVETGIPYGHGEDSIRCLDNTLRYLSSYENRDFSTALGYWRQVLDECPASSEELYIKGESLYKELYASTGETAYIDTVLMLLSTRTLWFGNKPANDLHKSLFLSGLGENATLYTQQRYSLIKEVADSFPDHMDHYWSVLLIEAAANAYSLDVIDTTEVLAAYMTAMGTVEKAPGSNPASLYAKAGDKIDSIFRSSGAMTCTSIEKIYSRKIGENIRNTVLTDKVFTLLEETGCTGSGFYYRIAAKMFADNKSAQNAVRLAELNYSRNDTDKALWYFTEAYKIDTSKTVRSDVLTRIASMELEAGKRQDARAHGETAYELNNKNGKALFIIAEAYAGSKIGDAFDNHSAYWVAVDYLKSAKAIDFSLKEAADEKIKEYSLLFPTREEGYYRGMTDEGVVYRVGGWIGEITKVRFRKE